VGLWILQQAATQTLGRAEAVFAIHGPSEGDPAGLYVTTLGGHRGPLTWEMLSRVQDRVAWISGARAALLGPDPTGASRWRSRPMSELLIQSRVDAPAHASGISTWLETTLTPDSHMPVWVALRRRPDGWPR
jgi:hypothetical protein